MNGQVNYPTGTTVIIVEATDKRQSELYRDYKKYIGKSGTVIGIGATLNNIPNITSALDKPINLYMIDIGIGETVLVPEEMLKERLDV